MPAILPEKSISRLGRVVLAVLLLGLAWPHVVVPVGLGAVAVVLALIAAHLHVVVTLAAVWLLLRAVPGVRRRLAGLRPARVGAVR